MKNSAIIRIIIFSVLIVLLSGILLAGLGIGYLTTVVKTDSSYNVATAAVALDPNSVTEIEIQWVSGDIHFVCEDTDSIDFHESSTTGKYERMAWKLDGSVLEIQYQQPRLQIGFLSQPNKDLQIVVPKDWICRSLDIETVSGDVIVDDLTVEFLKTDGVSAEWKFHNFRADTVSMSTVSGNITYTGSFNTFKCDGVSARCDLMPTTPAKEIDMDCVSGNLNLNIAQGFGFTLDFETASGNVHSQYNATQQGDRYTYGDGSCQINVDSISGNVYIKKIT